MKRYTVTPGLPSPLTAAAAELRACWERLNIAHKALADCRKDCTAARERLREQVLRGLSSPDLQDRIQARKYALAMGAYVVCPDCCGKPAASARCARCEGSGAVKPGQ
jgi:hypothetical protein